MWTSSYLSLIVAYPTLWQCHVFITFTGLVMHEARDTIMQYPEFASQLARAKKARNVKVHVVLLLELQSSRLPMFHIVEFCFGPKLGSF